MTLCTISLLLASCFSLDIADDFVRDARRAYAMPEYSAYTNSLVGTGRYAGRRLAQACAMRRPWREGSVKWISAPRADNIRDIGGWNGLKTGLVFRGSEFDTSKSSGISDAKNHDKAVYSNRDLTDEGLRVFREEMRIRTDLDLRNPKYHTVLGSDVNHVVRPVGAYHGMLASPKGRQTVAETLRVFADEKNYPVYVHCAGGADRTGSIMFLLEGICGVSEVDLSIDYELTSFGGIGYRQRFNHSYNFARLVALMRERPGATLSEQIRSYVRTELGLTDGEIASIRRILVAPADCGNDVVLEAGGKRLVVGLDGRIKPSNVPFLSVVGQDGEIVGCTSLADDARGDLYFGFSVKRACVVVGTEELPDGFAFPIRSSTFKNARIVLADEAKAVLAPHKRDARDLHAGQCITSSTVNTTACDLVIYGSSPAAIAAGVQARRMGRSVVIVSPETRIGGLTTGGLGQTDIGSKSAFGGIALEFYKAIAAYYADRSRWTRQTPESYFPDGQCAGSKDGESMWTFEPSAALAVLEGWERRDGLDIRRGEWLDRENGVEKKGGRLASIRTLSGKVYRGKVFVDATYEGDLMAAAGVSYTVGREANSVYGETLNGNQPEQAKYHQLNKGIDPYVVAGDPKSGLLPGIEPYDPAAKTGDGDRRVQAYCFRMCLTDDHENRIPFKKPDDYDERDYELLFRHLAIAPLDGIVMPWINSKMPNRKTDTNNRTGVSTDFIGQNWRWPDATYVEREKMRAAHLKYQRGLMWTLAYHPRVPERIRSEVSKWGTCKDEFLDGLGDGWQTQLYVREARRLVGEYVMTEHNCWGDAVAPRPVAMGAYPMDSHHVRRQVCADGYVRNEGDVEVKVRANGKRFEPYPIDYGAVLPKRAECENLIVPVCMSASHIAFGSIRMEPVFFALGQVAGTAGSLAAAKGVAVQDVPYGELSVRLLADGQRIALDNGADK